MDLYEALVAFLDEDGERRNVARASGDGVVGRPRSLPGPDAPHPTSLQKGRIDWRGLAILSTLFSVLAILALLNNYASDQWLRAWFEGHPVWILAFGAIGVLYLLTVATMLLGYSPSLSISKPRGRKKAPPEYPVD